MRRSASESIIAFTLLALMAGVAGVFVFGQQASNATADSKVTTQTVAAAAGAQVTPSDPKLRVEPK